MHHVNRLLVFSKCLCFVHVPDDAAFARDLFAAIRSIIHEFIALSRVSLADGVTTLETLLQGRVVRYYISCLPRYKLMGLLVLL